jgi:hypothetical protein
MGNHHALAFYPTDVMLGDAATTPFLSRFDHQLFAQNREEDLDTLDVFVEYFIVNTIILQQSVEIYKILSLLLYLRLLNLNNNVYQI